MLEKYQFQRKEHETVRSLSTTGQIYNRKLFNIQVLLCIGFVKPFLRENQELSNTTRQHLLEIFDDPQYANNQRLELATLNDAGVLFVSAIYQVEGDGPLIFEISRLHDSVVQCKHSI